MSQPPKRKYLLQAAFIAPMHGPILRDSAVVFADGLVIDVGQNRAMRAAHPDATCDDLGGVALLPGLVNAHTHLELSAARCGTSAGMPFTEWILSVRERSKLDPTALERDVSDATRTGIAQSLRFGVTCVGDISKFCKLTRAVLRESTIRAVSFGEVLGLAGLRTQFDEQLQLAMHPEPAGSSVRVGVSPHAPYTVDEPGYAKVIEAALSQRLPVATHLGESPDEQAFLEFQSGPFREVWERIGSWSEGVQTYRGSPIEFARASGLLSSAALLAHANYCTDAELDVLARGNASVVYCPRTHRYFGHPPHRWREMVARGINVAVGTDSCASSPDLNVVDDLRLAHSTCPEVPVEWLWSMVTTRAAQAIGMTVQIGRIARASVADFVAFDVQGARPLRWILEHQTLPSAVWVGGAKVYDSGV